MLSRTILIIDDETDSCFLLKTFLSQLHFQVFTACTLKEGMKMIDDISPSVVFLDNNLPDGLGWEHVDCILEKLPCAKINLISAYHYGGYKPDGNDMSGGKRVTVFTKPLSFSGILDHLV